MNLIQINIGRDSKATKKLTKHLATSSPHIIAINEPHYYFNKQQNRHKIGFISHNYQVISRESQTVPKSALLIRNDIGFLVDNEITTENCTVAMIENIVIISYYFEPQIKIENKRVEKDIQIDLNHLKHIIDKFSDKRIIIMSDSNAKHTVWGNRPDQQDQRAEKMHEFLLHNQLELLNRPELGATFEKEAKEQNANKVTTRRSHIDLTIINHLLDSNKFEWRLSDVLETDHKMIEISTNCRMKTKTHQIQKIDYENTDWEKVLSTFDHLKPTEFEIDNKENIIEQHNEAIREASKLITTRRTRRREDLPWYSEHLEKISEQITKVRRKRSTLRTVNAKYLALTERLKELNNELKRKSTIAIKAFIEKAHQVNNIKELWSLWKKSKFNPATQIPIFKNNQTKSKEENDRILADHFVKRTSNPYQRINIRPNRPVEKTNEKELREIIQGMSNRKAPGPDGVPNKLIKIFFNHHRAYFTNLFNLILSSCELPKSWMTGRMVYFTKPNRRLTKESDLRPITLVNGFPKIGEILFARRIENALDEANFFVDNQLGFRKGYSTEDAVKRTVENFKRARTHQYALMMAIDFSGAFDAISWHSIMKNATRANVDNSHLKMIQSLITQRTVLLEEMIIDPQRGTPQGGCASPLLFRIGTNDLHQKINRISGVKSTAYADDTSLIITADNEHSLKQKVDEVMHVIASWSGRAEIQLNKEKTEIMSIGKNKIKSVQIDNNSIDTIRQLKHLGIMIDDKLLWNGQLDFMAAKLDKIITRIQQTCWRNKNIELRKKMKIYTSVFLPVMLYCVNVWYPAIKEKITYMKKLTTMQRKAIRTICGAYRNANSRKLLEITQTIEIESEAEIRTQTASMEPAKRRETRRQMRKDRLNEREKLLNLGPNFDTLDITKRTTVWALTEAGPFRQYLYKCNLAEEETCRFCQQSVETAQHLIICEHFDFNITSNSTTEEFEECISHIIQELHTHTHTNYNQ